MTPTEMLVVTLTLPAGGGGARGGGGPGGAPGGGGLGSGLGGEGGTPRGGGMVGSSLTHLPYVTALARPDGACQT